MKRTSTIRGLFLVLSAALALAGCGSVSDSNPSTVQKVDPLKVTATDTSGQPVAPVQGVISLTKNYYFVIDGSGSMGESPPNSAGSDQQSFSTKMEGAKWAVKQSLTKIPADANIGLYVFDGYGEREVMSLVPNTKANRATFENSVDGIAAGGGTPLGDAIGKGTTALVDEYRKQLGYGEYHLIVVTDGEASDDLNSGVNEAIKYSIPIYTIGFGIGEDHALRKYSVSYKSADSAKAVKEGLDQATSELEVYDPKDFAPQK